MADADKPNPQIVANLPKAYLDSPRYSPFEKVNLEDSIDAEKLLQEFSQACAKSPKYDDDESLDLQDQLLDSGKKE